MNAVRRPVFYGWWVVLAAFLCNFASTGLMIYSFSLFIVPMSQALAVPRSSIAFAASVFTLCLGVVSAYVGAQVVGGRVKILILTGGALLVAGNLLLSLTTSVPVFYGCYVLLGIGSAFSGPAVTSTLATAWFRRNRGLAAGIISCGASVCAIFVPSILAVLMETWGVRTAFLANSVLVAGLLLVSFFLVRTRPQELGLLPDGVPVEVDPPAGPPAAPASGGLTLRQALKTPTMYLLCTAFAALGFAQIGVLQNAAPYLLDQHFRTREVASALGWIGFSGVISTVFFGWLADKVSPRAVFGFGNALLAAATFLLIGLKPGTDPAWLTGYALLFGFGMGVWASAVPLLFSGLLGAKHFGAIWGVAFAVRSVLGDTAGVPALSLVAEAGGYRLAFGIAIGLLVISAVLAFVAPKAKILEPEVALN